MLDWTHCAVKPGAWIELDAAATDWLDPTTRVVSGTRLRQPSEANQPLNCAFEGLTRE